MRLFRRKNSYEDLEREEWQLKMRLDCENSVAVLIELTQNLEALQSVSGTGNVDLVKFIAKECSMNPIFCCSNDELPFTGLKLVQNDIFNTFKSLEPNFDRDIVKGLCNLAINKRCAAVIAACDQAKVQLRAVAYQ